MTPSSLWGRLYTRLAERRGGIPHLVLQHLGLPEGDAHPLREVVERVGRELSLTLELNEDEGEVLLVDAPMAARLSMPLIDAYADGRPVVIIDGLRDLGDIDAEERLRRCETQLHEQLQALALVRRRSALARTLGHPGTASDETGTGEARATGTDFDSGFDSRLDDTQLAASGPQGARWQVVQAVLRGRRDPSTPVLAASYGAGANLRFDFAAGTVTIDPLAQRCLRLRRELPQPAPGARPSPSATDHDLDEVLWDLGIAAGPLPLLDEPADWWHATLERAPGGSIERYTRQPRHLEMARRLGESALSASALRRHARVGVADVRAFVQACLVLGLIRWSRGGPGRQA